MPGTHRAQDTDSVVTSLETGLGLAVHFLFVALYLLVWGVTIVQVCGVRGLRLMRMCRRRAPRPPRPLSACPRDCQGFATFSATALAISFVFSDSLKHVFENALFLFVEHPYDIGDALLLPSGMMARVKKIDLQVRALRARVQGDAGPDA